MKRATTFITVFAAALVGGAVAWGADAYVATMVGVLFVQPALMVAGALVLVAALTRNTKVLVLAAIPAAFAVPALLVPAASSDAWREPPALGCGAIAPPDRELRIVTFNSRAKSTEQDAKLLAAAVAEVDIIVLQEVGSKNFVKALADELGGEGVFSVTMGRYGQGIVVRNGVIPRCFGIQRYRKVPLPAARSRRASAVVAYARFQDGMVPIVSFHNDRPATLADFPDWPDDLRGSAQTLAQVASELPASVIVAGDSNTTPQFRHFHGQLGLQRATPRWSWPEPIPAVALDGVWFGPHWTEVRTGSSSAPVDSDHQLVQATVRPDRRQ